MTLSYPFVLLGLLLLVPFVATRRRRLSATAVPYAPLQYAKGSRLRAWLLRAQVPFEALLLAGVVLGLAGPHDLHDVELVGEDGLDVALALDISASMQAADFPPNRLEALKVLSTDFVKRSMGDRIAVYAFAAHAFAQTPLTTDRTTLTRLIEGLAYESIDHSRSGGTALGDALLAAADGLIRSRVPDRDQVVILLTDGESDGGIDPILAARYVAENEIGLYVVGIGGDEPVQVEVYGEPFIVRSGEVLTTRLDDTQLVELADAGGGRYERATDVDVLTRIFAELSRLDTAPLEIDAATLRVSRVPDLAAILFGLLTVWLLVNGFLLRRPLR